MTIDLNNSPLLRRAEIAFTAEFHGIIGADTELALRFGETLVSYTQDYNLRNPLHASSLLAEIALLGHRLGNEELAQKAGTRGFDMASCMSDDTAEQNGIFKEEKALVAYKHNVIGSIIAGEDTEEDVQIMQETLADAIRRYKLRHNTEDIEKIFSMTGRRNELATILLFNRMMPDKIFFNSSFLLDQGHAQIYRANNSIKLSMAVDSFGVTPTDLSAGAMFLQIKRNGDYKRAKSGLKYAPYICPVVWTDFINQNDIWIVEKAPDHPITIENEANLAKMVLTAKRHSDKHGNKKNGVVMPSQPEPLIFEFL